MPPPPKKTQKTKRQKQKQKTNKRKNHCKGIRLLVRHSFSLTARESDSIVGNMNMMCMRILNFYYLLSS